MARFTSVRIYFTFLVFFFLCGHLAVLFCQESPHNRPPTDISAIQHFVLIVKENRSFDSMFGTFPGAEGATTGTTSTGQVIPLQHAADGLARSPGYQWDDGNLVIDYGRMDKFDLENSGNVNNDYLLYSQLLSTDIPNYFTYASNFVLGDHMFVSLHGPSFPNHLYMIAAQSGGAIGNMVADKWGCDAASYSTGQVIDGHGNITMQYPCFDFATLGDSLENANLSWTYYAPNGSDWNAFDAINHVRNTALWTQRIALDSQFAVDALAGNLPSVSWLVPPSLFSEHPSNGSCAGENWTVQQVNAVMQGPDWPTTAIFVTWDDWGGLYDHVAPPGSGDQFGFGPRVPLLVISPYAKTAYISKTTFEFSSFLKLVEERFGLPTLTNRDAAANDMLDAFDFTQAARSPLILNTRDCSPASTTTLNFPRQTIGSASLPKTVVIQNYSLTSSMSISSIVVNGADFSQTNTCPSTLKAKLSCTINVTFNPTATGSRTCTLTITDSDITSPQVVNLVGVGTNVTLSPTLLSFGTHVIGSPATVLSAVLTNQGTSGITITGITVSGDYTQTNNCGGSLVAGASCNLTATFSPSAAGTRYGNVVVTSSDGGSPHVLNLTGVGTSMKLSALKVGFGTQALGTTSSPKIITLTNKGSSTVTFSAFSIVGSRNQLDYDFVQTNTCGTTLNGKSSCTFSVAFSPTDIGTRSASLLVFDSEAGTSPQIVSLTGTGQANPVPLLTPSLSPSSAAPGGAGFNLTVNGSNFLPSSKVYWNSAALSTTYVSSARITAAVSAQQIANAGLATITVVNPTPGGGTSNPVCFPVAASTSSVSFRTSTLPTGAQPSGIAAGDFDGNQKADLVITNQGDDTVTILLGNGDGTFTAASPVSTGHGPVAVATGDFNSDGKTDIAVANSLDNTVSILIGNGDGTFVVASSTPPTASTPMALLSADFNEDGRLDLAVVNNLENNVTILLGKGDGTFYPLASPVTGKSPIAAALADFNADGKLDIAVANKLDNTVLLIMGKGDGTFSPGATASVGTSPSGIVAVDLNNDGNMDVVAANQGSNTVSVLLGNGDGVLQAHNDYADDAGPTSIAAADFDRDGKLDLITSNGAANSVSVLLGGGDGTVKSYSSFATGNAPGALLFGDFNGDGKLDIAVLNSGVNTVSILLQN